MFWYIPTTHKLVIAALLAIAVVAFTLFWVTRSLSRRSQRALRRRVSVRHGTSVEPPSSTRDE